MRKNVDGQAKNAKQSFWLCVVAEEEKRKRSNNNDNIYELCTTRETSERSSMRQRIGRVERVECVVGTRRSRLVTKAQKMRDTFASEVSYDFVPP